MNIPRSILESAKEPHWTGQIEGEEIEIYFDAEMSKITPVKVYAVFSKLGFHGWMDEGYDYIQLLWIATGIAIPYELAANDFKQNEQLAHG